MPTFADGYNLRNTASANFNAAANAVDGAVSCHWGGTTGGSANAYTLTPSPAWTSDTRTAIRHIFFTPHASNTGATTFNISGLGVVTVRYQNRALAGGELVADVEALCVYDGTYLELLTHGGGWVAYTPTYGANGSMTFTSVSTTHGHYQARGGTVFFSVNASGTTGGTANTGLTFTVPITSVNEQPCLLAQTYDSGSITYPGIVLLNSTTSFIVHRHDGSNWGLGTGRTFRVRGHYRAA